MQDTDVTTRAQLEARLALSGALKNARLWRIAEGRVGWLDAIGIVAAALLVVFGLLQYGHTVGVAEFMRSGIVFVVVGLMMLGSAQWSSIHRQRNALLELIKRIEEGRS